MFIDHTSSLPTPSPESAVPPPTPSRKKFLVLGGIVLVVVVVVVGGAWYFLTQRTKPEPTPPTETPEVVLPPNPTTSLPGEEENINNSDFKAETLAFGSFYKSVSEPLDVKITGVKLPLNVKAEVSNYYTVARKLNLDSAVNSLNTNGFAVIASPFPKASDNFYGVYKELADREVPLLITSDFLLYYYQNSLKQIYKDIEASYFYDSLWKVNKQLFEVANGRYLDRQRKLGGNTDALLEGERLEAGYFATALALLTPKEGQINSREDLNDTRFFAPSEKDKYQFSVPGYLTDDVNRELALIQAATKQEKSPLLLYQRNYAEFKIPDEYAGNAKLKNVYLSNRWQTTVFPLGYRQENCQNCTLDRDDWTINQIAAYLISEHLAGNQNLKNEWAKVYKVISYFSGLRSGLTYLHYQNARQAVFGSKTAEEIFSGEAMLDNLLKLQTEVEKVTFKTAEGAYHVDNEAERPLVGMRLLQPPYWPGYYIYNQLLGDHVGAHPLVYTNQGKPASFFTSCSDGQTITRCKGLGFDMIGTVTAYTPATTFYRDNLNYQNYNRQRQQLQAEFSKFDKGEWYINYFWTALNIIKGFLTDHPSVLPYTQTSAWQYHQLATSLAGMTAADLSADQWQLNRGTADSTLETSSGADKFHYVEVQSQLSDELVANSTMIFNALVSLDIVTDSDPKFRELIDTLKKLRESARQELRGEALSSMQQQFIADLVRQYTVSKAGERTRTTAFYDDKGQRTKMLQQTVGPLELLVMIYEQGGKKILAVGPVWHYLEN